MIKKILVIVLVFVGGISYAQEGTSSPYSFYGVGSQKFKGTVENRSMGGLSVLGDSIHLNLQNPAAYGELALTTYTIGTSYRNFEIGNVTESSSGDDTSLDYLAVGIPAGKFGFGFGVVPLTSVGYKLVDVVEDESEVLFTGTGGLNKVFVSTGYKLNKNLNIGLDLNYNFGNIERKSLLTLEDIQYSTREITSSNLSAFSVSFGVMYKAMISQKLELSASIVSTPSFDLSSESIRELATVIVTTSGQEGVVEEQEIEINDEEINLPAEFKFGTGIGEPLKWFVGAEYVYADAGEYTNFVSGQNKIEYEDVSKLKIGGYFVPKYNSLTSYFSRVVYRAGLRLEETGLSINDQTIEEFGISFGVGLPVGRLFSNTNIGFEYGQRGTKDFGLVQEAFFNVSLSFSLNDKWFRKIKFN
ncbi:hypothetical protein [Aquimarina pacifica]|uniref:hypothetical protein n=1 Tax=Aquimarina pacifica TaxID=1296415 RepID=UPI00046F8DFC|nr:hypothetical protein [Aquimarina pacifica]